MGTQAIATIAVVVIAAGGVIATLLVRRARKSGDNEPSTKRTLRDRRALHRALEQSDAPKALLICSIDASGMVALDVDGDDAARVSTFASQVAQHFGTGEVFRVSSHEIAVLLRDSDTTTVRRDAEIARDLAASAGLEGMVTVGTANGHASRGADLWARADAAAAQARERGSGAVVAYQDVASTTIVVTRDDADAVADLLRTGRVSVTYHPVFDISTRRLVGFEALARPDRTYRLDGPAHAFATARRIGRAAELDALCRSAVLDDGPGFDMPVGALLFLNVTPAGLTHESLAPPELLAAVRGAGLSPERIVFELTVPSTLDSRTVTAGARRLKDLGFKLALDDLGAGRASTDLIGLVAADYLKVDPNLLRSAASGDRMGQAVLQAICIIAGEADATVIAEGVENEALFNLTSAVPALPLHHPGIGAAQGHYLAQPRPRPQLLDGELEPVVEQVAEQVADEVDSSAG